jgi:hypothetical protein
MFEVDGSIPRREESRGVSVCDYFPVLGWLPDALHSLALFGFTLLAQRVGCAYFWKILA